MERKRFYDRDRFTYEEKQDVAAKSDNRCCHCGTVKFVNYGATVDHFIPLYKGGSNRMLNLIMLCEKCNKEKDDKIVDISYIPYLKEEYKDELYNYLQSYIQSFDYVARSKMFALDEYSVLLLNDNYYQAIQTRKGRSKALKSRPVGTKYFIKSARAEDFVRLCDYFEKYLKKYDAFDSREAVEANVGFWMQFGCIYYIEKNNDIFMMVVFTVKHMPDISNNKGITKTLNMYIFSYYASDNAYAIASNIVREFPGFILNEQHLPFIPVTVKLFHDDKLANPILRQISRKDTPWIGPNGFYEIPLNMCVRDVPNVNVLEQKDIDRVKKFFEQFDDIENKLIEFVKKDSSSQWVDWMLYDIMSCNDIDRNGIFDNNTILKERNDRLVKLFSPRVESDSDSVYYISDENQDMIFETKDGTKVKISMDDK